MNHRFFAGLATAALIAGCSAETNLTAQGAAALSGRVVDDADAAVAGAELSIAIGAAPVTERVRTDADGNYRLEIPVDQVQTALAAGEEVTVMVHSPREDRAPFGTYEGDRVHLTPITLEQFMKVDTLAVGAELAMRDAIVPVQKQGHAITEDLKANGGRLEWTFADSPVGPLTVALIVAPNSIHMEADDPQTEITLTPIAPEKAPMQIPEGGYGPLWTIQPRGVVFDPPAKVEFTGERMALLGMTPPDVGETFELFGASLEQGWQRFGDVEIVTSEAGMVTLRSVEGIIRRGAWGHVFANATTDSGVLVTCLDNVTAQPVPCAVFDDNFPTPNSGHVAQTQRDYQDQHFKVYFTDIEPLCANCRTGSNPPSTQLALGLNVCQNAADPAHCVANPAQYATQINLRAIRLCPNVFGTATTPQGRIDFAETNVPTSGPNAGDGVSNLYNCLWWHQGHACGITQAGGLLPYGEVHFGINPRNFSYAATIYVPPCE